jgi:TatA/E family protein of Tat protein translocase
MPVHAASDLVLGYFNLGGGEIILILALVLILFGAKKLPDLAKGLGRGIHEFRDAADDVASEAGRSVGGIYGKRAGQALTPDNHVAELYNPSVFNREKRQPRRCRIKAWFLRLRRAVMAWWGKGA